jgi:polar amino acid transport system substrate-binding protein
LNTKRWLIAIIFVWTFSAAAQAVKVYKFIMQEYEPFNWTVDNVHHGGMIDVTKKICDNLKIVCKFESLPMKRVITMLSNGETDAVLSLIPNSDRDSFTELSAPIIGSNMSYFSIKGDYTKTSQLNDLDGATVGVVALSSGEKIARDHQKSLKGLNLISETGIPILLSKFIGGRYGKKGLVFVNEDVFATSLHKLNFENFEVVHIGRKDLFSVGFSKKNVSPDFIRKFNEEIQKMKKTGELKKLLTPYKLSPAK